MSSESRVPPEARQYCAHCDRVIIVFNIKEVEMGLYIGYIFVHDEVNHPEDYWEIRSPESQLQ